MRGLYLLFVYFFPQVLGEKPELRDGEEDDDMIADITNRKMAKLYMVGSLLGSSVVFTGLEAAGEACTGRDSLLQMAFLLIALKEKCVGRIRSLL